MSRPGLEGVQDANWHLERGRRFHNALRILMSLDRHELAEAGVIIPDDRDRDWRYLNDEPIGFVLCLDDERFDKLWALIESRQPKRGVT